MLARQQWSRENIGISVRGLGAYLLCLGIYYFYDKTVSSGAETKQLGILPYLVISLWYSWIFVHNRILLRKFAFRKKITAYVITAVIGIILTALVQQQIVRITRGIDRDFFGIFISVSFYTFIGAIVFLAFQYIKERKDFYQTNALKKEIELQQLKNQLNPHFLFNALNTIYSYNLENNAYGNDLILKLSQLMRFIVESSREETIRLQEEIDFIDNYIAFEKERLGYRCTIQYEKNLAFLEKPIPPLILFPFIENAFKHGTNTIQQSTIAIKLTDSEKDLELIVRNQIVGKNGHSTQVGLSNVGRRLELLFPGKHQLDIQYNTADYIVHLKLELV